MGRRGSAQRRTERGKATARDPEGDRRATPARQSSPGRKSPRSVSLSLLPPRLRAWTAAHHPAPAPAPAPAGPARPPASPAACAPARPPGPQTDLSKEPSHRPPATSGLPQRPAMGQTEAQDRAKPHLTPQPAGLLPSSPTGQLPFRKSPTRTVRTAATPSSPKAPWEGRDPAASERRLLGENSPFPRELRKDLKFLPPPSQLRFFWLRRGGFYSQLGGFYYDLQAVRYSIFFR